jgi:hypothetical protein
MSKHPVPTFATFPNTILALGDSWASTAPDEMGGNSDEHGSKRIR